MELYIVFQVKNKIKEHHIKQAYEVDHLEATRGLKLSKQRKDALEALIVEQIDLAVIAEIDPASIEGQRSSERKLIAQLALEADKIRAEQHKSKPKPRAKSCDDDYDMEL